jgi:hypothetical protein
MVIRGSSPSYKDEEDTPINPAQKKEDKRKKERKALASLNNAKGVDIEDKAKRLPSAAADIVRRRSVTACSP